MDVGAAWSSKEWALAIADLPRAGPLPVATVLVPRPAIAHALRRELVQLGRRDTLAGTLFVGARPLAMAVLSNAGRVVREREEELRPARLRASSGSVISRPPEGRDVVRCPETTKCPRRVTMRRGPHDTGES